MDHTNKEMVEKYRTYTITAARSVIKAKQALADAEGNLSRVLANLSEWEYRLGQETKGAATAAREEILGIPVVNVSAEEIRGGDKTPIVFGTSPVAKEEVAYPGPFESAIKQVHEAFAQGALEVTLTCDGRTVATISSNGYVRMA